MLTHTPMPARTPTPTWPRPLALVRDLLVEAPCLWHPACHVGGGAAAAACVRASPLAFGRESARRRRRVGGSRCSTCVFVPVCTWSPVCPLLVPSQALNILLFAEILDHITRIDRVLSMEGGALLLVGRSGAYWAALCLLHHHPPPPLPRSISQRSHTRSFSHTLNPSVCTPADYPTQPRHP